MFEQLKYKNHINEVFEFGKDGIFVNMNDLHDYEWSVVSKGNRISALQRTVSTRKLPIVIMCDTEEKGIAARNKLLEVCDKDVLAMKHGQIIVGDYYFKCYVTKSTKGNYMSGKHYMELTLTLTSDYPYWVKEKMQTFGVIESESATGSDTLTWDGNTEGLEFVDAGDDTLLYKISDATPTLAEVQQGGTLVIDGQTFEFTSDDVMAMGDVYTIFNMQGGLIVPTDNAEVFGVTIPSKGFYMMMPCDYSLTIPNYTGFGGGDSGAEDLDYPYDYAFDYLSNIANTELNNTDFVPSNFKMLIYGVCVDPSITVGGHTYQVNCTVGESEYLTIDSTTKKVYLTANDGTIINQFNNRNKSSYIFEKIPVGTSAVTWVGDFGFDIILMEERSEPKWT